MTDLVVVAIVGIVASRTTRAEFTPVNRAVARRMVRVDHRWERCVIGGVCRVEEEWRAEALRLGVCKDAVQWGAIPIIRPYLRDIAEVDDERIGTRLDELPFTIVQHFET